MGYLSWTGIVLEALGILSVAFLYGRRIRRLKADVNDLGVTADKRDWPPTDFWQGSQQLTVAIPHGADALTRTDAEVRELRRRMDEHVNLHEVGDNAQMEGLLDVKLHAREARRLGSLDELRFLETAYAVTVLAVLLGVLLQILGELLGV